MSITFIILIAVVLVIVAVASLFGGGGGDENPDEKVEKAKFKYERKKFFLTRAEHEFYDALVRAVGQDYHIFAQVHLPTILEHTIKGQDWRASLSHINRKSVDFVLCDKAYLSPKLAIELDDKSHEREDRQERDREVERILAEAGLPLLRIENQGAFNAEELSQKINNIIKV